DAEHDLVELRLAAHLVVPLRERVEADELGAELVEGQAEVVEALFQDARGGARLLRGVGPAVDEGGRGLPAVGVGGGDLEEFGRRPPRDAVDAHAVGGLLLQPDRREVGHAVGRDVVAGVADLVAELLGDGGRRGEAAGAGVLGGGGGAMGPGLDDGEADLGHVRDGLPVGEVAAGGLRAALEDVAGDGAGGHPVPVVLGPAELVDHRGEGEAGVGRPPGDDDIGAALERLDDGAGAEVGVRAHDAVAHGGQRRARLHVLQPDALGQQIVEPVHEVVAGDDGDLEAGDAALAGVPDDGLGAGRRVDAAGVRDHLEPLLPDVRQQLRDDLDEVAGVAGAGVAEALLLEDGHGDLGEVVHHEVVDGPLAGLVEGGALEVAPEALAGGDADGVFHENGRDGRGLEDTGWTAPSYLGSPLPPAPPMRPALLYLVLVGLPLLGVLGILRAGSGLAAPPSFGGAWALAPASYPDGCTPPAELRVAQSGRRAEVALGAETEAAEVDGRRLR